MKFSIKFKIVALGAILSILVTSIALIFANFEYRNRGRQNQLNDINECLTYTKNDFEDPNIRDDEIWIVSSIKDYVEQQYALHPDDPEQGLTYDQLKNFYMDRFKWMYAIEGIAMYRMSDEEAAFRDMYQDFITELSEIKAATISTVVYYAFIDENNNFFFCGDNQSYKKNSKLDTLLPGSRYHNFSAKFTLNGDFYDVVIDGKMHRGYKILDNQNKELGYYLVQYNFDYVNSDTDSMIVTEAIVLSITSVVMIIAFAVGSHFLLIRNISKLTQSASEFTDNMNQGNTLEAKDPQIKSKDEIRTLANSFVSLEEGIIQYIDLIQKETIEKERSEAELRVATNIQLSALPNNAYDDRNVSIRSFIKSAKEVGGDFYDYFYLDDHRLVIVISDVSGKGIPAALFMMKSKELIKSVVRENNSLVDAARVVNKTLCSSDKDSLFVTSFIGIIDFNKSIITYVNAGHEKPYIISPKGVIKLDGESNFVFGGEEDFEYKEESHAFNKGEYIFLFTDGLNESINNVREEFSYSRIEENLSSSNGLSLQEVIDQMNNSLEEFVEGKEQFDDVTMLVVKNQIDELNLSYDKKDYSIITEIVDTFNTSFSFLKDEVKASAGIVIDELVNNLISYEKREDLKIDISFKIKNDNLMIVIKSNGNDYDPFTNHQEKYYDDYNDEIKEGGFGLSIIKDIAKSHDYKYKDHHSIITIEFEIK